MKPTSKSLLNWYDSHRRHLPWRAAPGVSADPYEVWLSEIMLQQTTVVTVAPYFTAFLKRWPRVEALAAADLDDVLHAWAGLGYYARARNLHKCARAVAHDFGGKFPDTEAALLTLPGIGPYTAAAIAAIAFDRQATVVDGNVERVMARIFAIEEELPAAKTDIKNHAEKLTPKSRPGDYAQSVMDLGATICTPRNPACDLCPWMKACQARKLGLQETLPRKAPKKPKPTRRGIVFWGERSDGAILINQRPEKGLLASMWEIPSSPWETADPKAAFAKNIIAAHAPVKADWQRRNALISHTFTHFHLELALVAAKVGRRAKSTRGKFVAAENLEDFAFPSVMKKVIAAARIGAGRDFS